MAMRKTFPSCRLARLGALLFLLTTLLLLTGSDRTSEIKVIELKGLPAVIIMADGSTPPVRVGELLPLGATVKTPPDSTMKLLFANGAVVILQPRSQLRLALFASKDSVEAQKNLNARTPESSESTTNLDLKSGTVLIDVPTLKKESKFEVTTPLGIAGVRGTRFYVSAKKDRTSVGVAEGLVITTSLLGESTRVGVNQAIGLTPKGSAPATANEIQYIQTLDAAFGGMPHRPVNPSPKPTPKSSAGYRVSE
jgi:ferric-dicitrate binding protein FerR (iron transport regulator)